jgi:hypothetical protein
MHHGRAKTRHLASQASDTRVKPAYDDRLVSQASVVTAIHRHSGESQNPPSLY